MISNKIKDQERLGSPEPGTEVLLRGPLLFGSDVKL